MNLRLLLSKVLIPVLILLPLILYLNTNLSVFRASVSTITTPSGVMGVLLLISLILFVCLAAVFRRRSGEGIMVAAAVAVSVYIFYSYFSKLKLPIFVPNIPITSALESGNILLGLLSLFASYFTGFLICLLLTKDSKISALSGLVFGLGATAVVTMILGFASEIYLTWCVIVTVILISMLLFLNRRNLANTYNHTRKIGFFGLKNAFLENLAPLLFVITFLAIDLYFVIIYPATEWDSLAYGPPYSALIYSDHAIPLLYGPSIGIEMSANYPPGLQLLVAYSYVFAGGAFDFYYRLSTFLFGVSTIALAYLTGKEYFGDRAGGWYTSLPMLAIYNFVWFMDSTSYIVATTAAYSVCILFLVMWQKKKETRYLVLSGIGAGIALLTSYEGLFAFVFILVVIGWETRKLTAFLRNMVWVFASGSFSLIWLVRNWIVLGNPLYPLLGIGKGLTPLLYASSRNEIFYNGWSGFWNTFANLSAFINGNGISIGPFFLIVVSLFLLLFFIKREQKEHREIGLYLLLGIAIPFVLSGLNGFFDRYFVITIIPIGLAFASIHRYFKGSRITVLRKLTTVILVIGLASTGLLIEQISSFPNHNISSTSGYLAQTYGNDANTWNWINTHTAPGSVIASYEIRTYYIDRPVIPLDGSELSFLYNESLTPSQVYNGLRALNVSYILSVSWTNPAGNAQAVPDAYYETPLTKYLGDPEYFQTVFTTPVDAVYSVSKNNSYSVQRELSPYSHLEVNRQMNFTFDITNRTSPPSFMVYLNLSPDFLNEPLLISAKSSENLSVELWSGFISENYTTGWWNSYIRIASSPNPTTGGLLNPSLNTKCRAGEFTLVLTDWSPFIAPFNTTVTISIPHAYPSA